MNGPSEVLAGAAQVEAAVRSLAEAIDARTSRPERVAFVGIHTHGVPLADRLKEIFDRRHGVNAPSGTVDITLYRDDYDLRGVKPRLQSSRIRFPVDDMELVLVDDVLFTGRTIRAAIESLGDYGRPASIRLAVLVDRGHRELPIQPDAAGIVVETRKDDRVRVRMKELDGLDEVTLVRG
ncbi:MAG: bifunctional pyr operon transcriptional regulator/uracil phosphoribosyltransferase PyrR [Candidatus Omnitrophica bacterium]|nr:Bifunctional protein PyrR [bacterium]NUN94743.1 bifunctional pyr operon transcriptional regulator/uracil phosphoribosyltransferase PyrR [Candidatus Omnitrophota bacterium]